jgi:NADPH2:quinone reductase
MPGHSASPALGTTSVSIPYPGKEDEMKAIRVHEAGGPEVLRAEEIPVPSPGPTQAVVKHEAIGVNFLDTYQRAGLYKMALPFVAGNEAAGTVAAVGSEVRDLKPGDRVAYAPCLGAYAEYAAVPAARLVPVPTGVSSEAAAASILQGMTAQYLATSVYPLKAGDTALIHAAAGGVGLLLVQIAKLRGARVLATVSTPAKAELARGAGADLVIRYTEQDFEAEVLQATGGKGVNVVYDAVARTTFDQSLNCLAARGVLALFGQSSGPVPPFDLSRLAKAAAFVTRPGLGHYTATREELLGRAAEVFGWVAAGTLRLRIDRRLPLAEARAAHLALEGRQTAGKVMLLP